MPSAPKFSLISFRSGARNLPRCARIALQPLLNSALRCPIFTKACYSAVLS